MDHRIEAVVKKLDVGFRDQLNLQELGQLVNLSPSRLRHLYKVERGETPTQHLHFLRMQEAGTLLQTTFLSVKEIMNQVGMCDFSNFTREFKRVHGMPPTRYRSTAKALAATGSTSMPTT